MCGIAGMMLRGKQEPIGRQVLEMLQLLYHRGPDAAGMGCYYPRRESCTLRVACRHPQTDVEALRRLVEEYGTFRVEAVEATHSPYWVIQAEVKLPAEAEGALQERLNRREEFCVHSLSRCLQVFKNTGQATHLHDYRSWREAAFTHILGHVRLATESLDNLNFAHPLTSALLPELTIVHNGQLTNYFNLRRQLEKKGVVFKTFNDSELIAHYLAYQITRGGMTLYEAMTASLAVLDGVYSYVAATGREMGAVQDKLGLKPILIYESAEMLLLASEQICFSVLGEALAGEEITPGEARVWSL